MPLEAAGIGDGDLQIYSQAFSIVEMMKAEHISWRAVKKVLKSFKKAVSAQEGGFMWDE